MKWQLATQTINQDFKEQIKKAWVVLSPRMRPIRKDSEKRME